MPSVERACVNVDIHNGIAWVNLNRPHKKNAMSPQLHEDMDATLVELEFDDKVGARPARNPRRRCWRRTSWPAAWTMRCCNRARSTTCSPSSAARRTPW